MVQTALILLLTPPEDAFNLNVPFKWSLLGLAVSLSQTIGLNFDSKTWQISQAQIRLRRRLSWLVYALDTWFALYLGRPPHISDENWLIAHLDVGALDPVDAEEGRCTLALRFSGLTSIVNRILQRLL